MDDRLALIDAEILRCRLLLRANDGDDAWKEKLRQVVAAMNGLESQEWYVKFLKARLVDTAQKIAGYDIGNADLWKKTRSRLDRTVGVLEVFNEGSVAGGIFAPLHAGLVAGIGGYADWIALASKEERVEKICYILRCMGAAVQRMDDAALTRALGANDLVQIHTVAEILQSV
jgi:hypothetical protein